MKISVHDNLLVSYEVLCERREIRLHTEFRDRAPVEHTDVIFRGVEAYFFEGDNFGNIISGLDEVPPGQLVSQNAALFERGRKYAWPGYWNLSYEAVCAYVDSRKLHGYRLSSSYGMTGWVLAAGMDMISKD